MNAAPFVALPRGRHAWMAIGFALSFVLLWLLLYGGADRLAALVPCRIQVAFAIESRIPFVPSAALAYLSMGLLLGLLPFALKTWQALFPVWLSLCVQTVLASACFVALPVQTMFPPREASGWIGAVFDLADTLNLANNFLPSLHVAYATTAVLALQAHAAPWVRTGLWVWASLIAASTMLMHEHQLLDVIAGGLLAIVASNRCSRWASQPRVLRAANLEVLCLRDLVLFTRRHRRYGPIAIAVLVAGIPHWRERRLLRLGFCFLQHVDDLLDGDRPAPREPLEIVDELVHSMRTGTFGTSDLMQMAEAFREDLLHAGGEAAIGKALSLIGLMRRDRERVLNGTLMSKAALQAHHRATFVHSVDLLLLACGSSWSADQVPELVDLFAWCSPTRDLQSDLAAGLVNVPGELLGAASARDLPPFNDLIARPAIRQWLMAEQRQAQALLPRLNQRLAHLRATAKPRDQRALRALAMLSAAIRVFARRQLPRLYPFLADRNSAVQQA